MTEADVLILPFRIVQPHKEKYPDGISLTVSGVIPRWINCPRGTAARKTQVFTVFLKYRLNENNYTLMKGKKC
ncbi:MAG: hypothetical protein MIO88_05740, partial [Methanoregulaceae archaeon]|nr:hypothetical protein [Methanoregulaceae archaeon]